MSDMTHKNLSVRAYHLFFCVTGEQGAEQALFDRMDGGIERLCTPTP